MIEICLVAFGAVLLLGSIGAFFLYIPLLPIAVVVVILLGMVLAFLIGVSVGGTRVLRLRLNKRRVRRLRLRRAAAELYANPDPAGLPATAPAGPEFAQCPNDDVEASTPLALSARSDG